MIILHKGTEEHREPWTSSPQGEPGPPPTVLMPQSPCTATRAVGVGTLWRDTIYAATAETKLRATGVHTHTHCRGSSLRRLRASSQRLHARARGLACVQAHSGAAPASWVLQLVWVRVGLCGPCSPRQGRAPLCPHKPTQAREGQ